MTKLDWAKAKNRRDGEAASPGKKPRRKIVAVDNWDDLERVASGGEPPRVGFARQVSAVEIAAKMTPKGAWSRATLAEWGVPWPPPRGWKDALIAGLPIPQRRSDEEGDRVVLIEKPEKSLEAKLLHKAVMAVINANMAHLFADEPEILSYFGGSMPTVRDMVPTATPEMVTGEITLDDRVWSFTCARSVRRAA